jgi:ATP-binding cassette subfamily B multidrug efflux pump
MEEINRFSTSSLINRTTNDITQIQNLVVMSLQAIVKAPILATWAIVKNSGKSLQWTTVTAVALAVLVTMLAITLIYALPRFQRIQGLTDNLNRVTREQLTGIRVVCAYNAEQYQEDKFGKANDELTETNLVANRVMSIMSPGMTLINSGLTLAVYWLESVIIEAADATAKLGIFSNYARQVIMAFIMLNMIFVLLPRAQVSAKRINEVLQTKNKIVDGVGTEKTTLPSGTLEFRNVSFRAS